MTGFFAKIICPSLQFGKIVDEDDAAFERSVQNMPAFPFSDLTYC
ncbi:hypothetical protein EBME_0647 [bacterium endosymbiont of Mortierella elongata FMR23-6]|nr:hypothetical protein EBME_0647 [bacterium endosymbiont of Mortierella elongata FMR23-6]